MREWKVYSVFSSKTLKLISPSKSELCISASLPPDLLCSSLGAYSLPYTKGLRGSLESIIQTIMVGLAEVYENVNLVSYMHLVPSCLQWTFWVGEKEKHF